MNRETSDESYVIDLCDSILGRQAIRQKRFDFLRGDPNKNGNQATLPVDGYYEELGLAIEYWERQHEYPAPFWDRKMTCSGCTRGEQRRIYDKRKREVLQGNGIRLVVIRFEQLDHTLQGRLKRSAEQDMDAVSDVFRAFASHNPPNAKVDLPAFANPPIDSPHAANGSGPIEPVATLPEGGTCMTIQELPFTAYPGGGREQLKQRSGLITRHADGPEFMRITGANHCAYWDLT